MGYYIKTPVTRGKALYLIDQEKAKVLTAPYPFLTGEKVTICVVENGLFDAAGICFSARELQDFAQPDGRRKTWLSMDRARVIELCPYAKDVLEAYGKGAEPSSDND